jgi:hypothetical protein
MAFRAGSCALTVSLVLFAGSAAAGASDSAASANDAPASLPLPTAPATVVPTQQDTDLLNRARVSNQQLYTDLESFVCNEQIARFEARLSGEKAHQIDTVTAKVSFENGIENYTEVRQNKRRRSAISGVSGAWSEGEYGTLLQQTQVFLTTQRVRFLKNADVDGTPAAVYGFDVSAEDSPWDLQVGAQHYRLPFRTEVSVSRDSGRILRIERTSTNLSAETLISEVRWSVRLAPVEMNGRTWLLPTTGEYAVTYQGSDRREWNLMSFSDYRRYGSEVAVRFDEVK